MLQTLNYGLLAITKDFNFDLKETITTVTKIAVPAILGVILLIVIIVSIVQARGNKKDRIKTSLYQVKVLNK